MHCIMIYFDWESFRRVIKTLRITGLRQLQGILDLLIVDCWLFGYGKGILYERYHSRLFTFFKQYYYLYLYSLHLACSYGLHTATPLPASSCPEYRCRIYQYFLNITNRIVPARLIDVVLNDDE